MQCASVAAISGLVIGLIPVSARAVDASPGEAGATDEWCDTINAPIVSTFFVDGCTSPAGVCTQGTIPSGRLAGTTVFTVLTVEPGNLPNLLLYTGELVISTPAGDLIIHDTGVFDAVDLTFSEIDPIVGGTGGLRLATGVLFSQGIRTDTGFDGVIFGDMCVLPGDKPPDN